MSRPLLLLAARSPTTLLRPPSCALARPSRRFFRPAPTAWAAVQASCIDDLEQRGLAESITGPKGALRDHVAQKPVVVYAGVDATATSLHVGHLLPLMNLLHFYLNGHHAISIVGKATASVGDPSGRTTERNEMMARQLQLQFDSIWKQLERFYDNGKAYALRRGYSEERMGKREIVTNSDWLDQVGLVEFLNTVGRHVRVGQMLARDSVKGRMESAQGINYAEFTYQLLQSYDFWHLYRTKGCEVQVGGNDQYGNITAGIDLITRLQKVHNSDAESSQADAPKAFGLTVPLLTTPNGEKIGKTAGNAVWLDPTLTTPFDLYQYFVRLPDSVVQSYLGRFTLLTMPMIREIMDDHSKAPENRRAQHVLAGEVVELIHGVDESKRARVQTEVLFPSNDSKVVAVSGEEVVNAFSDKVVKLAREEVVDKSLISVLKAVKAVESSSEAKRMIYSGAVYVGPKSEQVKNHSEPIKEEWMLDGSVLLLRVGKGKFTVVQLE